MNPSATLVQSILHLDKVTVKYGFTKAIETVSFDLIPGMALGLIGANGAGKTTSIRAILGMLGVSEGKITIFEESKMTPKLLARIGFAPEEATPPEYLTAKEYLTFLSKFKIKAQESSEHSIESLLSWFELDPNKPIRKYSKGMRRRLVLSQAFLGKPDLIILDEPLNGLDPIMIQKLRERVVESRRSGASILYSSHILSELENSCTDVVMMHKGKVVMKGTIPALVETYGSVEKAFAANVGGN
ncbi:MAG: ABC transporter ATP-binding protein [Deltaproteobacteria bacterium]|nr:ABC transporter ATP-binding protein [Deltaproteobacteria bacterium]